MKKFYSHILYEKVLMIGLELIRCLVANFFETLFDTCCGIKYRRKKLLLLRVPHCIFNNSKTNHSNDSINYDIFYSFLVVRVVLQKVANFS